MTNDRTFIREHVIKEELLKACKAALAHFAFSGPVLEDPDDRAKQFEVLEQLKSAIAKAETR